MSIQVRYTMDLCVLLGVYVLSCIIQRMVCHTTDLEPVCTSRFDFESKLLERMVMVEHRMNLLQESLTKELENLLTEKQAMEHTMQVLSEQLASELTQKLNEITQTSADLESKFIAKFDGFTAMSTQVKAEQKAFKDEMMSSFNEMELKTNTSMNAFKDEAIKSAVVFYMRDPSELSPGLDHVVLKFTTPITNKDNVYNPQSGYFTVPVAGVYMFAAQICGVQSKATNFRIYVNDVMISDTTQYDPDTYSCTTTNAVTILKVGDRVCVKTGPNTSSGQTIIRSTYLWSTFMGTLVN